MYVELKNIKSKVLKHLLAHHTFFIKHLQDLFTSEIALFNIIYLLLISLDKKIINKMVNEFTIKLKVEHKMIKLITH